jgi:Cu/Ag efflux pump CusA
MAPRRRSPAVLLKALNEKLIERKVESRYVALLLIFGLLYVTYQNWIDVLRVFTAVPFGWVGGILALWVRDMPFSISAAIGFIALSGVAVLDAMILVSYIRQLRAKGFDGVVSIEVLSATMRDMDPDEFTRRAFAAANRYWG